MAEPLKLDGYGATFPKGLPAWSRSANIGDYGGAPDKEESTHEATDPYAWHVYQLMQSARGDAYSRTVGGTLVHAENLAIGRLLGAVFWRSAEKQIANATPERADEKLPYWVALLAVRTKDGQQDWEIRQSCVAKFKVTEGPTEANINQVLTDLLGDTFIETIVTKGTDLDNPPDVTYWPIINPGPSILDLGGGTWMSHRAHLGVKVEKPETGDEPAFLELMNVQMQDLLDGLLPGWATFGWATFEGTSSDVGFLLDISQLDFTGLGS
jgi:hypothetical protein